MTLKVTCCLDNLPHVCYTGVMSENSTLGYMLGERAYLKRNCVACGTKLDKATGGKKFCSRKCRDLERKLRTIPKPKLAPTEYRRMLESQGVSCAICGTHATDCSKARLDIDHDHSTGKIRGLLCFNCNIGLGAFCDDTERLRKAIIYLNLHTQTSEED